MSAQLEVTSPSVILVDGLLHLAGEIGLGLFVQKVRGRVCACAALDLYVGLEGFIISYDKVLSSTQHMLPGIFFQLPRRGRPRPAGDHYTQKS